MCNQFLFSYIPWSNILFLIFQSQHMRSRNVDNRVERCSNSVLDTYTQIILVKIIFSIKQCSRYTCVTFRVKLLSFNKRKNETLFLWFYPNVNHVYPKCLMLNDQLLHNASWILKERLPTVFVSGGWRNFRPSNSDVS